MAEAVVTQEQLQLEKMAYRSVLKPILAKVSRIYLTAAKDLLLLESAVDGACAGSIKIKRSKVLVEMRIRQWNM